MHTAIAAAAVPTGNATTGTAAAPPFVQYMYGAVEAEAQVQRDAMTDFARIANDLVGLEFSSGELGFAVFVYEYASMTDEEIAGLIADYCRELDAPVGCITEQDIEEGQVCGGVCGRVEHMVMDFSVGDQHRDRRWGASRIQEYTVHETTHIFQRQNSAPAFENDLGGDITEDWRANGCRWWMEGTAVFLGDRVLNAYPEYFSAPDPDRTNFGRSLAENCDSLNTTEAETGLRLTNAAQASDEPWEKMFELGKYYEMVYEGGYCATTFFIDTVDPSAIEGEIQRILSVIVESGAGRRDSWEVAFLAVRCAALSMSAFN
jgi:hypothetical protein